MLRTVESTPAERARAVATAGSLEAALESGSLEALHTLTAAEALVLGLLAQDVKTYLVVFGHGTTELGEQLRIYAGAGLIKVVPCRSEIEAAHAAMALTWVTGEQSAVVTSIGPGALQAAAASLAALSDGVGVWHIYGDETTRDEGPNMQQIPTPDQHSYLRVLSGMGPTAVLHTPEALPSVLRRGAVTTNHPYRSQPFRLLFPINTQPQTIAEFDLRRLPGRTDLTPGPAAPKSGYRDAARHLLSGERVVIKVGAGAAGCTAELARLAELSDGVFVMSPMSLGVVPDGHPRQMGVGGSKGSLSGNYAMERADTLVVVGSRAVCQSDCSRTGYPQVRQVININADVHDVTHYNRTTSLLGDVRLTLQHLISALEDEVGSASATPTPEHSDAADGASGTANDRSSSAWFSGCRAVREKWNTFRAERTAMSPLKDEAWGRPVLTQPAALGVVLDWIVERGHVAFFDAGDVQANGFQQAIVEEPGWFFTEAGASYMGFATSAVLAGGLARNPFYGVAMTGDGSFVMNPQALIDCVHTDTRGAIIIFDNRRMGAISSLQLDQYGTDFATSDLVDVDYVAWARSVKGVHAVFGGYSAAELRDALNSVDGHDGLSVVHVPVYFGSDERGGMGSYGRWNVGPWVADVQQRIEKAVI